MTTKATTRPSTATPTAALSTPVKPEPQEMDDQLFHQLFHLEDVGASSVSSPWMSPDFYAAPQSVHSTPEIATPQDMFLTSPSSPSFDKQQQHLGFGDLDVSALLDMATPSEAPMPALPLQQCAQTVQPVSHEQLTAGLFSDLSVALAALAAGTAAPQDTASGVSSPSTSTTSPAVQPIPMPVAADAAAAATATATTSRKRSRQATEQTSAAVAAAAVDEVALKRQKNTDAARRSRLRKVLKMESLENRVSELERANTTLLLRAAVLESEKSALLAKESSYEQRIKNLEAQLFEAHQSLAGIAKRM
ncbi:hypothetical protein BX666DRAFT_1931175 [Dichotomocladium elegans]|nr:hypothetical protein BX666DRAFT_1931175 [Dichotomocladium elegans]